MNKIKKRIKFIKDFNKYKKLAASQGINYEFFPCLDDNTATTSFEPHYFYQGTWAFEKIKSNDAKTHVDVGSEIRWVGLLSTFKKVIFVDIRPFKTDLENLEIIEGNILKLPFSDNSIESLSCLHVAEHIGLGRYGDELDPEGTKKACRELARVLSSGGSLYFSLPVGQEKTYFNAHRVHSPERIINYFKGLKLKELSGVVNNKLIKNVDKEILRKAKYACGLFWFMKE